MQAQRFSLSAGDGGTIKLSVTLKADGRAGVERMSQAFSAADTTQLVLFCEAAELHRILGTPNQAELDLGNISFRTDPRSGQLHLSRPLGARIQKTSLPFFDFHAQMAPIADRCRTAALDTKYGPKIAAILDATPLPQAVLPGDAADTGHTAGRLRLICLLLLVEDADRKGSELESLLRAKTRAEDAEAEIGAFLLTICEMILPPAEAA